MLSFLIFITSWNIPFFYQCDRIILFEDEATFSEVNKLNPNSIELSNPMQRAQFEKATNMLNSTVKAKQVQNIFG